MWGVETLRVSTNICSDEETIAVGPSGCLYLRLLLVVLAQDCT